MYFVSYATGEANNKKPSSVFSVTSVVKVFDFVFELVKGIKSVR